MFEVLLGLALVLVLGLLGLLTGLDVLTGFGLLTGLGVLLLLLLLLLLLRLFAPSLPATIFISHNKSVSNTHNPSKIQVSLRSKCHKPRIRCTCIYVGYENVFHIGYKKVD